MIRVCTKDDTFNLAWRNARGALPVHELEQPRQYEHRWRKAYRCRVDPDSSKWPHIYYIFDCDEDYTWFMLRWA